MPFNSSQTRAKAKNYSVFYSIALFVSIRNFSKNNFSYFPVFDSIKNISQTKTIFGQPEKYNLFLEVIFH